MWGWSVQWLIPRDAGVMLGVPDSAERGRAWWGVESWEAGAGGTGGRRVVDHWGKDTKVINLNKRTKNTAEAVAATVYASHVPHLVEVIICRFGLDSGLFSFLFFFFISLWIQRALVCLCFVLLKIYWKKLKKNHRLLTGSTLSILHIVEFNKGIFY